MEKTDQEKRERNLFAPPEEESEAAAEEVIERGPTGGILIVSKIVAIMGRLGAMRKTERNKDQGYMFWGIEALLKKLSKEMAAERIVVLQDALSSTKEDRAYKSGGTGIRVSVKMRYTMVCAEDGSTLRMSAYGEAIDSSDKATNKAETAAFKNALKRLFLIETEPQSTDPDHGSPEAGERQQQGRNQQRAQQQPPREKEAPLPEDNAAVYGALMVLLNDTEISPDKRRIPLFDGTERIALKRQADTEKRNLQALNSFYQDTKAKADMRRKDAKEHGRVVYLGEAVLSAGPAAQPPSVSAEERK
ncbi:MAG: ERF family protein [bacterium]